jgi:hypothetical protein
VRFVSVAYNPDSTFLTDSWSLEIASLPDAEGRVAPVVVERMARSGFEDGTRTVATLIATPVR